MAKFKFLTDNKTIIITKFIDYEKNAVVFIQSFVVIHQFILQ